MLWQPGVIVASRGGRLQPLLVSLRWWRLQQRLPQQQQQPTGWSTQMRKVPPQWSPSRAGQQAAGCFSTASTKTKTTMTPHDLKMISAASDAAVEAGEKSHGRLLPKKNYNADVDDNNDNSQHPQQEQQQLKNQEGRDTKATSAATIPTTTTTAKVKSVSTPLAKTQLFRYLGLETFSDQELNALFDRIRQIKIDDNNNNSTKMYVTTTNTDTNNHLPSPPPSSVWSHPSMNHSHHYEDEQPTMETRVDIRHLRAFFAGRLAELELEASQSTDNPNGNTNNNSSSGSNGSNDTDRARQEFVHTESHRIWDSLVLPMTNENKKKNTATTNNKKETTISLSSSTASAFLTREVFCRSIRTQAEAVDIGRTWPIVTSMVLVGSSVGIITPAMPFVVQQLSLTVSEYGMIVSAFALAKMAANIPSAVLIEKHGRKRYMVRGLGWIALAVGGIGAASSFEELFVCRLVIGAGVSLLSGAATLMVADLSTPLNRASTMAPIMSGFSAGMALGPALGGVLVDSVGLNPTFYVVGLSFLGVAVLNHFILVETQRRPLQFPWQTTTTTTTTTATSLPSLATPTSSASSTGTAIQNAVGQWLPLLRRPRVQGILIMNGFYWFALAGGQMTLLPLLLTGDDWHLTASEVGRAYMGMSLIQIVGTPVFARIMDRLGKAPAMAAGCTLIGSAMATLPLIAVAAASPTTMTTTTTEAATTVLTTTPTLLPEVVLGLMEGMAIQPHYVYLAGVMGIWAVGSSMMSTAPVAYISDQVEESERAQAIALLRTCGDVGFLGGATLMGVVAQFTDTASAMQASGAVLLAATTWFAVRQPFLLHQLLPTGGEHDGAKGTEAVTSPPQWNAPSLSSSTTTTRSPPTITSSPTTTTSATTSVKDKPIQ